MEKQVIKSVEYSLNQLENIASAYVFYKDWSIAKDIAGIKNTSVIKIILMNQTK
jgi:hypothetical protein